MIGAFEVMREGVAEMKNPARGSGRGWVVAILSFDTR